MDPSATGTFAPSPSPSPTPMRTAAPLPEGFRLDVEVVAEGLPELTDVASPPGDDRLFVTTQEGAVLVLNEAGGEPEVFLDLTDRVRTGAEQGLLEIAFHPTFADDRRFLVHYTEAPDGDTRIVEYRATADGRRADRASERVVFALDQPHRWHNGGQLLFGPDGYLWVGLGDGGPGGDPEGHAQDPSTVFGSILRIDLEATGGQHGDYGIPPDNPFADGDGGAPEVWAYGLRNPWQFSLDEVGGHVYIGDVGQFIYEEIDIVPLEGGAGANFGWSIREGAHCFEGEPCDAPGLVEPVAEYVHEAGRCAVVGGPVYRGAAIPELWGHYLYADSCSGDLWSFLYQDGEATDQRTWTDQVGALPQPTSFGLDSDGEVLISTLGGSVHRIVPGS